MTLYPIRSSDKLNNLTAALGVKNIPSILHTNNLNRVPKIGQEYDKLCEDVIKHTDPVTSQRKQTILSKLTGDEDIYERACQLDENGWKILSALDTLPGYIRIPDDVTIKRTISTLGNGKSVSRKVFSATIKDIRADKNIDQSIFNEYSSVGNYSIKGTGSDEEDALFTDSASRVNPLSVFKFPWKDVILRTDEGKQVEFPCYPEDVSDSYKMNTTNMPDLIYQYEPWVVYNSSGPRQNTYEFHFHRDMWNADHRKGGANKLVRFCEALVYPKYKGSSVHVVQASLYVAGSELIHGIVTDVSPKWSGPIGLDGWYLECTLDITILEISRKALNYDVMRRKKIIG